MGTRAIAQIKQQLSLTLKKRPKNKSKFKDFVLIGHKHYFLIPESKHSIHDFP